MAMMMTGKSRSSSNASSTRGNMNATTISSAGIPYFLSAATALLTASLHRGTVAEQVRRPEHQNQDEHGEDHDRRPPDGINSPACQAPPPPERAPDIGIMSRFLMPEWRNW